MEIINVNGGQYVPLEQHQKWVEKIQDKLANVLSENEYLKAQYSNMETQIESVKEAYRILQDELTTIRQSRG